MGKTDQGLIVLWMAAHHWKRPLRYIGFGGHGKQVRDVLHIDDFCDLVVDQLQNFDAYQGNRYNAGGGPSNAASLHELTTLCEQITGNQIPITPDPETRPADVKLYITDNRRLTADHDWTPQRTLAQTLESIHHWLTNAGDDIKTVLLGGVRP